MTRIRIDLDESPQKVHFEYAQRHDMTIDLELLEDFQNSLSLNVEKLKKKEDDFNNNFLKNI